MAISELLCKELGKDIIMKLIYLEWGYPYDSDIQKAFIEKEAEVFPFRLAAKVDNYLYPPLGEEEMTQLQALVEKKKPDMIFSINFLAGISEFCKSNGLIYGSWVLQLPNMDLFTESVRNGCNRIGICDSFLAERLWKEGITNVFFLPDAVVGCQRVKYDTIRACSFVGKVPFAYADTPFSTASKDLSENTMGYLAGTAHCQRVLYGATVLEDILIGAPAGEFMGKYPTPRQIMPQLGRLYLTEAYLTPEVTRLEQIILLQNMSSGVDIEIFTDGEFPDCTGKKQGYPENLQEKLEIYGSSIINLVQADRSYHDAIPHQVLEIMASGNFVLVNYQKDFGYFFKQEETIVCYGDRLERAQLYNKYGMDPKERKRVCDAAFEAVRAGHTYAHRIDFMLENWEV